jgi:hypothetical protein
VADWWQHLQPGKAAYSSEKRVLVASMTTYLKTFSKGEKVELQKAQKGV